jgi:hypothetical protein
MTRPCGFPNQGKGKGRKSQWYGSYQRRHRDVATAVKICATLPGLSDNSDT